MENINVISAPAHVFDESFVSNIQGGVIICRFDPSTGSSRASFMSEGWTKITGYSLEELEAYFNGNPQALVIPEDGIKAGASYIAQTSVGNRYSLEYRIRHKDGRILWMLDRGVIVFKENGFNENQSIITDITSVKENEETLRVSEERFRIATRASGATVFEFDIASNTYVHAENAEAAFAVSQETFIHAVHMAKKEKEDFSFSDALAVWFYREDIELLLSVHETLLQSGYSVSTVRVNRGGHIPTWCKMHAALIYDRDGAPYRVVGHVVDIDEEHKNNLRLQREAQSDALTGLFNKMAVHEIVKQALEKKPRQMRSLLLLDIDDFKGVNDRMGHLFGDAVLMDVSNKLKRLFQSYGVVGRIGGDEFVVLLHERYTEEDVVASAAAICSAFRQTYVGEKADYKISCSVGIAYSAEEDTFETFFRKADVALYQAKAKGKDCYVIYTAADESVTLVEGNPEAFMPGDSGKLAIKERIFELLYGSNDFSGSVNMILALLGQLLDMSRIYIFERREDKNCASMIYGWCGDGLASDEEGMKDFPVAAIDYFSMFNEVGIIDMKETDLLPDEVRGWYEAYGIRSSYQIAIKDEGEIVGFMGYDSMNIIWNRTPEAIDLMNFAAKVTGTFIIKKRAEESKKLFNENKMEALDSLPSVIYVIDEGYQIHYMNDMLLQTFPKATLGEKCHELFMNSSTPCLECPGLCCETSPCSRKMYSPVSAHWMVTTANKIRWSGRDNMRMICCQIID